jgi:hypothetical protein
MQGLKKEKRNFFKANFRYISSIHHIVHHDKGKEGGKKRKRRGKEEKRRGKEEKGRGKEEKRMGKEGRRGTLFFLINGQ